MGFWRPWIFGGGGLRRRLAPVAVAPLALLAAAAAADDSAVRVRPDPQAQAAHEEHGAIEGMPSDSPDLQVRLFGDLGFHLGDQAGETRSFSLGQLDGFFASRLSDTLSALSEVAFRSAGAGAQQVGRVGDSNTFSLSLERLLLQYSSSDYLRIAAGRYHTAIGYYNTAYHHGTWFQTATGRPFLFSFERDGGPLPSHNVGVTVSGRIPSGRLGLRYVLEVGNGRAYHVTEAVQNAVDADNDKAVNLALLARPGWASGLQLGGSFYFDRLSPPDTARLSQQIAAFYAVYHGGGLELLNELVLIRHSPLGTSQRFDTTGFYVQASRDIGRLRPYVRYQSFDAAAGDPILGQVGRRRGPSLGVRFDPSEFVALKLQYDRTSSRTRRASDTVDDVVNGLMAQAAFTF